MAELEEGERSGTETIGKRIRRLRRERGLSLRELAAAGVSFSHLSRIENEDRTPSIHVIRAIARKLGVSPEYLEHGHELSVREELELALADVEVRVRLQPDDPEIREAIRVLLERAEREAEAEIAARARAARGVLAITNGRIMEAIPDLEIALTHPLMGPDVVPDTYVALIRAYGAADRVDDSVVLCEKALQSIHRDDTPRRIVFATYLSGYLSERGDFERAERVLLELEPDLAHVDLYSRARLHWSLAHVATGQEKRRVALRHMRTALSLLNGTEDTERLARAHMGCASILLWGGTTRGVAQHLAAARALMPASTDPVSRSQLLSLEALLLARAGELRQAGDVADEALALAEKPGTSQAAAIYAAALAATAERDFDRADELFARVLELRLRSNLWREAAAIARDRASARRAAGDGEGADRWEREADSYATKVPAPN
jgi:transcriptional regulator with XRE-family HTH domain